METKRTKVVMLSTKDKTKIVRQTNGTLEYNTKPLYGLNHLSWKHQHLYFTNEEDIKTGNWFVDGEDVWRANDVRGGNVYFFKKEDDTYDYVANNPKKIIATTDRKLIYSSYWEGKEITDCLALPQPSQAFIEKYCKVNGIKEVLIEYEKYLIEYKPKNHKWVTLLKIDSHNTITIHPVEPVLYDEDAVIALIMLDRERCIEQCEGIYNWYHRRINEFPKELHSQYKEAQNAITRVKIGIKDLMPLDDPRTHAQRIKERYFNN